MAQTFESWWASLGPITKFTLVICMFLGAAATFQWVDFTHFFFALPLMIVEPWRIVTSTFFLGPFSMSFMFNLVFLVMYQKRLEEEDYPLGFMGRTADHVWMMLAIVVVLIPMAVFFGMRLLSMSFIMSVVWVWCKRHEQQELVFYGFAFKAGYFPWILTLIHVLMGSSPLNDVCGIVAGHFYVCTKDVFPNTHNISIMNTPQFMYNIFPPSRVGVTSVAGAQTFVPDARAGNVPQAQGPHRWGRGRRLGD
eukprot:TRINITY_DN4608_c0_g1_i1.p1 TRINITY_DN4608_c0_g1~~TRINITY_DN4608_c0_g1_i1.p1  ORF type:complete len:251 (+),score=40.43 TRINITY_DN4608_c0_g1_i1:644-1396(+)